MKITILGSGGREFAIGKKLLEQNSSLQLYFIPGNGGTENLGKNLMLTSQQEILDFTIQENIDLTIVGPENLLVEGIVDAFRKNNLPIFGADQKAAQLEGNKALAKDFMKKYGVKTAHYQNFSNFIDAREYLQDITFPVVIKASGIAAGKGVVICNDVFEAEKTLKEIMNEKVFGEAGNQVVIEEFLHGFEVSILSFFNGNSIYTMLSAQDHKKIGEGDTGPNTGGMGVVVPNPHFTEKDQQNFEEQILQPTLQGLKMEGYHFSGVIFFGLMVNENGCYLLEYNMRFGDPETQTLLPLLQSNFLTHIHQCLKEEAVTFEWNPQSSVCVVMASGGYPRQFEKGFEIKGLQNLSPKEFDVAGAQQKNGKYYTSGGRVLNILAQAPTLPDALKKVYQTLQKVHFDYNYYRKDIGLN